MRFKLSIAACGLTAMLAVFVALPAFAQPKAGSPVAPVCANCHEDKWNAIDLTAHGAKSDANGSMCQACHGDASEHLKDPMKAKPDHPFKKGVPAARQAEVCLSCHSGNRNLAFWTSGKHSINEVACTNCHSIHGKTLAPSVNKFVTTFVQNQAETCWQCHQPIRAANFKPSHHPIIEGKVKCTDCHNPHGALSPAMVKQPTINDQCYSCHADKRGPYVFNHPPVESNCATCHNPHGSVHLKLLNESAPNLCQDCHEAARHPGTIYGAAGSYVCQPGDVAAACSSANTGKPNPAVSTRLVARACLNCHNNLHGSNAPGNRGKYFLR